MPPPPDTPRLQGKQCQDLTAPLGTGNGTGNDPKGMSVSQHHPQEVTQLSVPHSNSKVQRAAQECPCQGWGFSMPRHRLEETPLTKLMPVVLIPPFPWCAEPAPALNNPTPPGSTGGLTCSIHSEVPAPEPQTQPALQEMNTAPQSSVLQHQQRQFWRLDLEEAQGDATSLMCIPVEAGGRGTRTSLRGAEQHFSLNQRDVCWVILCVKLTEVITVLRLFPTHPPPPPSRWEPFTSQLFLHTQAHEH